MQERSCSSSSTHDDDSLISVYYSTPMLGLRPCGTALAGLGVAVTGGCYVNLSIRSLSI